MIMIACVRTNPFLEEWDTPYGIPPYDKIEFEDYIPAVKAGIEQQQGEVNAITANAEAPTFENTIVPLELSGEILSKVTGVLFNVAETENCPELEAIVEEVTPLLSEHADQSGLTREQQMVLKKHYEGFQRSGIGLPEDKQARMREINSEMATKINKIGNNILAESNAFKAEFGISVSAYPTAMTTTEDRDLRERMFKAYSSRGHNGNENDNRALILDVMRLREEKARLMGYDNPADFILENKMAHDHQTVDAFLDGIMKAAVAKAKEEIKDMEQIAGHKIEPWDWWYYAEKVRKAKYDLDEELTKPYFEANNVKKGLFLAANTLYGINVEEINDVPRYNPEVVTYKITAEDGSLVGIFTTDYFPRESKRGGAWMNTFRSQDIKDGIDRRPIVVIVTNFTKPTSDSPSLLTHDELTTFLHEFGHAIHGMMGQGQYPSQRGTNVARDFVELPSQIMENWAYEPEFLSGFATHYKTGEVIPQALIDKIVAAKNYNSAYLQVRQLHFGTLDMAWHEAVTLPEQGTLEFEKATLAPYMVFPEVEGTSISTSITHLFNGGYSAGYYSYKWAEVLEADAFSLFEQEGIFNKDVAASFRHNILEMGSSEDEAVIYRNFRGHDPEPEALLKKLGII